MKIHSFNNIYGNLARVLMLIEIGFRSQNTQPGVLVEVDLLAMMPEVMPEVMSEVIPEVICIALETRE